MSERDQRRAREAEALLANALWIEAWQALRDKCHGIFERAASDKVDEILEAKMLLEAGKFVEGYVKGVIINGKLTKDSNG